MSSWRHILTGNSRNQQDRIVHTLGSFQIDKYTYQVLLHLSLTFHIFHVLNLSLPDSCSGAAFRTCRLWVVKEVHLTVFSRRFLKQITDSTPTPFPD